MEEKTMAFRISGDLQREIKITLAKRGLTLKSYIIGLIEKDLYGTENSIDIKSIQEQAQYISEKAKLIIEMTNKK